MLTTEELSGMQSVAADALPDTAIIQKQTWASDGGGGGTTTWTASGTVDCRLSPATDENARETADGDRISVQADYTITLPHDASITTQSRILTNGGTFNVEAIDERGTWQITKRVDCTKEA